MQIQNINDSRNWEKNMNSTKSQVQFTPWNSSYFVFHLPTENHRNRPITPTLCLDSKKKSREENLLKNEKNVVQNDTDWGRRRRERFRCNWTHKISLPSMATFIGWALVFIILVYKVRKIYWLSWLDLVFFCTGILYALLGCWEIGGNWKRKVSTRTFQPKSGKPNLETFCFEGYQVLEVYFVWIKGCWGLVVVFVFSGDSWNGIERIEGHFSF